jgi:hypothetical protein
VAALRRSIAQYHGKMVAVIVCGGNLSEKVRTALV